MVQLKFEKDSKIQESRALINKKSSELVQVKVNSKYLGISTVIMYLITFIYIYASATYSGHLKWTNITLKRSFTLSEGLQYSEKIGTTILIITTLAMLQGYFASLNFYSVKDPGILSKCISVEVVTYLALMSWLLLFFVSRDNTYAHGLVAFVFSSTILFYAVMLRSIYNDVYVDEPGSKDLYNLDIVSYLVIASYCIILFFFILNVLIKGHTKFRLVKDYFIGTFEIVCIICYLIFFGMLTFLPPLPEDLDLICYSK